MTFNRHTNHSISEQKHNTSTLEPNGSGLYDGGFLTSLWFANIRYWTEDDCLHLLEYYLRHERTNRKGWNNNMSLVNQEGKEGDIVWSLIYWKFGYFQKGRPVIIPFTLRPDRRGILRASIKFYEIKHKTEFWSWKTSSIITNEEHREDLLNILRAQIIKRLNWKEGKYTNKNLVMRYRLVALLNDPKLELNRNLDAHHLNGAKELPRGNYDLAATDDRSFNIEIQHKSEHRRIHYFAGDTEFHDYREPKQLKLDI